MMHELAIGFWVGLLILLGAVLELTWRAGRDQVKAALRGDLARRG